MAVHDESPEAEALRRVPFFEDLTPEDLERICAIGERRTYAPSEVIVGKDEEGLDLFIVMSGAASVETGGAVHPLRPGDFFGEMALLANRRRSATVVATEPVEVMTIRSTYFKPFLVKNPSVAVALLEGVAARLREVQDRVDRSTGA